MYTFMNTVCFIDRMYETAEVTDSKSRPYPEDPACSHVLSARSVLSADLSPFSQADLVVSLEIPWQLLNA